MSSLRIEFDVFVALCEELRALGNAQKAKSKVFQEFVEVNALNGNSEELYRILRFLLPCSAADSKDAQRTYQLNNRLLLKHFSTIWSLNFEDLLDHLNKVSGEASLTIEHFWRTNDKSRGLPLSCSEVDSFLKKLSECGSVEQLQINVLKEMCEVCDSRHDRLRTIIRLVKKDMRLNAGAKVILDGINSYEVYQQCKSLKRVAERFCGQTLEGYCAVEPMNPVAPMLAQPCRKVDEAFSKLVRVYGDAIFAETKYDGERVQVHKKEHEFAFFSRSLKAVEHHKIRPFEKLIEKAFPTSISNIILDCEVLLFDCKTRQPLPFGTLGRKKAMQASAKSSQINPCLFVFDCLYYDNKNLLEESLERRRQLLEDCMIEQDGLIMLSRQVRVRNANHLTDLINQAIDEGLEGLVLKSGKGTYEPGKRHWLKVKKDYLADGSMADSADLVVLGAYYGTGSKAGILSVFLMGCYEEAYKRWCTVTKVGNGFTDTDLVRLQNELIMRKLEKDEALPEWFNCKRQYLPDYIVRNPKNSLVFEVSGAEFSTSLQHTANGISIRFPRVTRIRYDKTWKEATSLTHLTVLAKKLDGKLKQQPPNKPILNLSKLPAVLRGEIFSLYHVHLDESELNVVRRLIIGHGGQLCAHVNDNLSYVYTRQKPHATNTIALHDLFNRIKSG